MQENKDDFFNFFGHLRIKKNLYQKLDEETQKNITINLVEPALQEVYQRGDTMMLFFMGLHFLLALVFAYMHQTWFWTWVVGLGALGSFYLATIFAGKTFFTRVLAGVLIQVFVFLYLYQWHGLSEVRFFFFTSFITLIVYQDWRAMVVSVLIVLVQVSFLVFLGKTISESALYIKQYEDFILMIVSHDVKGNVNVQAFLLYILASIFQVILSGLWANFLKMQTISEILSTQAILKHEVEIEKINAQLEVKIQEKTQDLQIKIGELQANEEEIKQNMEELHTTQEEMQFQKLVLEENKKQLETTAQELQIKQSQMEIQQWIETNLTQFDTIMRLHYGKNLYEFVDVVLQQLAMLLNITQGAIYVYEEQPQSLIMYAGYACSPQTVKKNTFKSGEGIIGQMIRNKRPILLKQLPHEQGAIVNSALAKIYHKSLLVMPLLYNDELQGALEIAILDEFPKKYNDFLERLAKNIASMIQSMQGVLRTQKLLEKSQEITLQLQTNARELEKTKQEAEAKAFAYQRQFNALDQSLLVLELSAKGNIIRANDKFLQRSKFAKEDLEGKHFSVFLTETFINSIKYKQLALQIRKQEFVEVEYDCIAKDKSLFWIKAYFYSLDDGNTNIKNDAKSEVKNDDAHKIMVLAYDITTEKEQDFRIMEQLQVLRENEVQMHNTMETMQILQAENDYHARELQEQLNAINVSSAMLVLNPKEKIKLINDKFAQIIGYDDNELINKYHTDILTPKYASSKAYQKLWERLRNNEAVQSEFDFLAKNGEKVWLRGSYYPITNHNNKEISKVMFIASNITQEIQQQHDIKNYIMNLEVKQTKLQEKITKQDEFQNFSTKYLCAFTLDTKGIITEITETFSQRILPNIPNNKNFVGENYTQHMHLPEVMEKLKTKGKPLEQYVFLGNDMQKIAFCPFFDEDEQLEKVVCVVC